MTTYTTEPVHIQVRGRLGLLTEQETAETLLLTSADTLATWRSQKKGPSYVKLGKRVFYTVPDLAAWINEKAAEQCATRRADVELKVAA